MAVTLRDRRRHWVQEKHDAFEAFRRAVAEGRADLIGPAWARVVKAHRMLVRFSHHSRPTHISGVTG